MKKYLLIVTLAFFTLTNCSLDNNNNEGDQVVRVLWHLENVSGGPSDVDNNFSPNVVVWEFNEINSSLTVTNNNDTPSLEDGLNTGTYSYSFNDDDILFIDTNEIGKVTVTTTKLTIDGNIKISGTVEDGFIFTFNKQVIVEN